MNYLKIKNKKLYRLFYDFELERLQYKFIFSNIRLPYFIRQQAYVKLTNTKNSYVAIKNRCFITNKNRSLYNHFKLSRIKLRLLASNNYINGIKKYNK
jgi:ribosomal protein S14